MERRLNHRIEEYLIEFKNQIAGRIQTIIQGTEESGRDASSLGDIKAKCNSLAAFVYNYDKIVAGSTVFITDKVAHPQYISGNEQKNELGSLDFLYNYLIFQVFAAKNFFDFGPSHEENGMKINEGILFWKESFGAKTTVQDYYEVRTSDYHLLENVML
jgi:hypothetical protein